MSRALSLATVTLLIGCIGADEVQAQATNLEAGKTPSQIFAGTCNACHKSPRGLLKTVAASSLPGFLRQHYTTSSDMASVLASYLVSNGAADPRFQAKQEPGRQGKDAKQEPRQPAAGQPDHVDRFGRRQRAAAPVQEVATPEVVQDTKPDADGLTPQGEGGRAGRNAKRLARPGGAPDAAADSKSGPRHKLSKRGKGGEEQPKPEVVKPEAAKEEPAKSEPPKEDAAKTETAKTDASKTDTDSSKPDAAKPDAARVEADKPEVAKPTSEGKSETAKVDAPKENAGGEPTSSRSDPASPVIPAPATSPASEVPSTPEQAATPPAAAPPSSSAAPTPPAVTAAAPPPAPPAAPAGPPEPPISR